MMRILILLTMSALGFMACNESDNTNNPGNESTEKILTNNNKVSIGDTTKAAAWLIDAIRNHFESNSPTMEAMTTKEYYQYKTEATNVDMGINGSLDRLDFEQKWKDKFDTRYSGIQTGFLISAQDFGKVVVNSYDFLKDEADRLWFNVIIEDLDFKTKFPRQIAIIKEGDSFKIADVKEDKEG